MYPHFKLLLHECTKINIVGVFSIMKIEGGVYVAGSVTSFC